MLYLKNKILVLLFFTISLITYAQESDSKHLYLDDWETKSESIAKPVECISTSYREVLGRQDSTSFISEKRLYNKKGLLENLEAFSYEISYEYDDLNRIINQVVKDEKEKINHYVYNYFKDKVVIQNFDLENKLVGREEYFYKDNKLVQYKKYDEANDLELIRVLSYKGDTIIDCFQGDCFQYILNDNGLIKEEFECSTEGDCLKIFEYAYDNKGFAIEKKEFNNGLLINVYHFRYKKGILVEEEIFDSNNKVIYRKVCLTCR